MWIDHIRRMARLVVERPCTDLHLRSVFARSRVFMGTTGELRCSAWMVLSGDELAIFHSRLTLLEAQLDLDLAVCEEEEARERAERTARRSV
jgi:hypothetical protein